MKSWQPIDAADALGLLSSEFMNSEVWQNWHSPQKLDIFSPLTKVRQYAVSRLTLASDDELLDYLLQLVQVKWKFWGWKKEKLSFFGIFFSQAIRYENDPEDSPLTDLLIQRSSTRFEIANYVFWYLKVEIMDKKYSQSFLKVFEKLEKQLGDVSCNKKKLGNSWRYFCLNEKFVSSHPMVSLTFWSGKTKFLLGWIIFTQPYWKKGTVKIKSNFWGRNWR